MGNTFGANYWDGLAGIAMVSKGGFGVGGEGFRRALVIVLGVCLIFVIFLKKREGIKPTF